MADFLEERLDDRIRYGSDYQDQYSVSIVTTSGGQEYRSMFHNFPVRTFDVSYLLDNDDTYLKLHAIYHRAHGMYGGFRIRCFDEWSSNGRTSTPTETDQLCKKVNTTVWQLRKWYGTNGTAGTSGYPYRTIKKPVSGTVKIAVNGALVAGPGANWTVDTTTGLVTLSGAVAATVVADNVRAGFEFDFPVRFDTVLPIGQDYVSRRSVDGVRLRELLNP